MPSVYPEFTQKTSRGSCCRKKVKPQRTTAARLTDAAIKRYRPSTSRREISDGRVSGLAPDHPGEDRREVVSPCASRRPDNTHAKFTLGSYDENGKELEGVPVVGQPLTLAAARALAASVMRQRALGVDVIEERRTAKLRQRDANADREANVFSCALIEFFVDHKTRKSVRPRRWREDAAQLGYRFKPNSDPAVDEPRSSEVALPMSGKTRRSRRLMAISFMARLMRRVSRTPQKAARHSLRCRCFSDGR